MIIDRLHKINDWVEQLILIEETGEYAFGKEMTEEGNITPSTANPAVVDPVIMALGLLESILYQITEAKTEYLEQGDM